MDVIRLEDGILAEHWDVIQDEAFEQASRSGLPMLGSAFPARRPVAEAAADSPGPQR